MKLRGIPEFVLRNTRVPRNSIWGTSVLQFFLLQFLAANTDVYRYSYLLHFLFYVWDIFLQQIKKNALLFRRNLLLPNFTD